MQDEKLEKRKSASDSSTRLIEDDIIATIKSQGLSRVLELSDYWMEAITRAELDDKLRDIRSKMQMATPALCQEAVSKYLMQSLIDVSQYFKKTPMAQFRCGAAAAVISKNLGGVLDAEIERLERLKQAQEALDESDIQPESPSPQAG